MLSREVFILEFLAVNALSACAVALREIATLEHEVGNDAMETAALVTKTFLACAQCAEIFGCLRHDVIVELKPKEPNASVHVHNIMYDQTVSTPLRLSTFRLLQVRLDQLHLLQFCLERASATSSLFNKMLLTMLYIFLM